MQKYLKSVSSTQLTILSLLPDETSVNINVWLLMWSEQSGVKSYKQQTTTRTLQESETWTWHHFLL